MGVARRGSTTAAATRQKWILIPPWSSFIELSFHHLYWYIVSSPPLFSSFCFPSQLKLQPVTCGLWRHCSQAARELTLSGTNLCPESKGSIFNIERSPFASVRFFFPMSSSPLPARESPPQRHHDATPGERKQVFSERAAVSGCWPGASRKDWKRLLKKLSRGANRKIFVLVSMDSEAEVSFGDQQQEVTCRGSDGGGAAPVVLWCAGHSELPFEIVSVFPSIVLKKKKKKSFKILGLARRPLMNTEFHSK